MASKNTVLYFSPAVDIILSEGADVTEPAKRVMDIKLVLTLMEEQINMVDNLISCLGRGSIGGFGYINLLNFRAELQTAKDHPTVPYHFWDNVAVTELPFTFKVYLADSGAFGKWQVPTSVSMRQIDYNAILDDQEVMKTKVESLKALQAVLSPPAPEEADNGNKEQDAGDDDDWEFDGFSDDDVKAEKPAPAPIAPLYKYELDAAQTKKGTTYDPATGIVTADNGDGSPLTYQLDPYFDGADMGVFGHNGKMRFVLKRVYH